jgi:hypothetical protein
MLKAGEILVGGQDVSISGPHADWINPDLAIVDPETVQLLRGWPKPTSPSASESRPLTSPPSKRAVATSRSASGDVKPPRRHSFRCLRGWDKRP